MEKRRIRRAIAVVALSGLVAACARPLPTPLTSPLPPAPAVPPPVSGSTTRWVNPAQRFSVMTPLHLRSRPNVAAAVIGMLPQGARVQATGSRRGSWWEVQTPDGTGWVSSRYLAPS